MKKIIALLVLAALFTGGCSRLSVAHLPQNLFQPDQTETLSMDYWDFTYLGRLENGRYVVRGNAYPNSRALPGWGEWLQDFSLSAYLSDDSGKVLARDLAWHPVQKLAPEGIEFEFGMSGENIVPGSDVFVSFGYSMSLTPGRYDSPCIRSPLTGDKDVFTAVQGALPR